MDLEKVVIRGVSIGIGDVVHLRLHVSNEKMYSVAYGGYCDGRLWFISDELIQKGLDIQTKEAISYIELVHKAEDAIVYASRGQYDRGSEIMVNINPHTPEAVQIVLFHEKNVLVIRTNGEYAFLKVCYKLRTRYSKP